MPIQDNDPSHGEVSDVVSPSPSGRFDLALTRRILALALPVALTGQMENLVGIADIYMVGKLGPAAISAVGISRQVIMVIGVTMIAVTTGTFTMVAQAIGAGSQVRASAAAKQSFTLVTLIGILMSAAGIVGAPHLLASLSVSPEVVDLGTPYLRVFFGGIVLLALNFCVTTCLHGAGDTRTPFHIGLLINSVKLLLSYLFIFGVWGFPRLGVAGAALGTLVGRLVGVVAGFWVLYSGRFRIALTRGTPYRPDPALARRILRIGIPAGLQGLLRNGSNLIFVKLVALTASSTTAVAAYSIGNQIERVLRRTSLAFGTAANTLVGQGLGAGRPDESERRGWNVLMVAILTALLLGLPVVAFPRSIMQLFTDSADVVGIGIFYLYAIALAEPFMCAAITSGGGLRGAGDTVPALYYTLIAQWIIRLPAAFLLAFTIGYDILGIWVALVVSGVLQGILTVRKYAQGRWKSRTI
jgi:putative MATE family efflux protein